ncbi:hypothetical protein LMG24235_06700 [Paraburkholderia sabiae]|nr:hypothetical protein LMG24235_06700 [Paraburkholderia sabiae]
MKSFVVFSFAMVSMGAHAAKPEQCAAFGDKFAEYARDRDAGMSMQSAAKEAKARDGANGEMFVAGVYLNSQMVRTTPNEIRALAVKSCLDQ